MEKYEIGRTLRIMRHVPDCKISPSGYCTRCGHSPIAQWKFFEHGTGEYVTGERDFNFCPTCGARIVK